MAAIPHASFDSYAMNVDGGSASPFPSGSRIPPPLAGSQYQHHPGQQPLPYPPGPSRSQHHPQPASSLHNHSQGQFPTDEVTLVAVNPGQNQYFSGPAQGAGGPSNQIHHLGRSRPISPVHVGASGPGGKQGGWVGDGRMPGAHQSGGKQGPEYGWVGMHEGMDDGRDRDREFKRERERERDKLRERERADFERERAQEQNYLMQQPPHRHAPPHQHQHPLNSSAQSPHHHQVPHHYHRHHHHVIHNHHPQQLSGGGGPSVPPLAISPGPQGPGSVLSPHVAPSRDFELSRSHPVSTHPPEIVNLSASKQPNSPSHWKRDDLSASDYRDIRGRHGSRPSSTHPGTGLYDDRERPLATPFVMASSQVMSSAGVPGPPNGQSSATTSSPRLPWSEEHGSRISSSSSPFPGPLGRGSPLGLSPPRSRPPAPRSPSSSLPFPGPMRSPSRYTPSSSAAPLAEPPMHSLSSIHTPLVSTPVSPEPERTPSKFATTHEGGSNGSSDYIFSPSPFRSGENIDASSSGTSHGHT